MSPPSPQESKTRSRKHAANRATTLLLGVAAFLALLLVGAVFTAQAWLEAYLKSDDFRHRVESAMSRVLNSEVRLSKLRREGSSLSSESLDAEGSAGARFKQLELHGLHAEVDLGGLWKRVWRLDHLKIQNLRANFDTPEASAAPAANLSPPTSPPAWLSAILPKRGEFGTLQADLCDLQKGSLDARQIRLTATPSGVDWEITAESGELRLPNAPTLSLVSAKLVLRNHALALRNSRFLVPGGGELTASGDWSESDGTDLRAQLKNVPLDGILHPWWRTRLKGNLQGELRFQKTAAEGSSQECSGTLELQSGRLEALPILAHLETFLGSSRLRSIPLKKASAKIHLTQDRKTFQNIDFDGDGLIRIQGTVVIEGESLHGQLQLGLSPSLMQWLPAARSFLFKEQRDGYVWTPIELSGSLANPTENLSEKLLDASKDSVLNAIQSVTPVVPPATAPAVDTLKNSAKGALDALKSVLPGK